MGDWLTIIIVLLILGILLDGWRRMRNAQRDSLKVSRSMRSSASASSSERDDYSSVELPNGGARVVAYRDSSEGNAGEHSGQSTVRTRTRPAAAETSDAPQTPAWAQEPPSVDDPDLSRERIEQESIEAAQLDAAHAAVPHRSRPADPETPDVNEAEPEFADEHEPVAEVPEFQEAEPPPSPQPGPASEGRGRAPQQVALNLEESVPILMETTEHDDQQRRSAADGLDESERIEPTFGGGQKPTANTATETREPAGSPRAKRKPSFGSALGASLSSKALQAKEAFEAKIAHSGLRQNAHSEAPEPASGLASARSQPEAAPRATAQAPRSRSAAPKAAASAPPQPEEVLVVNIMAPEGEQFRGSPLLEAVMRAGLRYGDMNIFHRYQDSRGGGPILFSLANMVKPGIFDLDAMDDFSTPGVSLFMTLPLEGARDANVEVFDRMLDSARAIADELGGDLKDENRSVMTRQTMEHCRQRIHEFERKQLSRAPD